MAATEPIRDKKQLKQLAEYYLRKGQHRNYALIVLGVHTALRISDLLCLTWNDVFDFSRGEFHSHISLIEKKTGKSKSIALNDRVITALQLHFPHRRDDNFIFSNRRKNPSAISRVQAYRIIHEAVIALGLVERFSCHSLRKTFGYHAWNSGVPVAVLMDIYNHSSYEITKRYLGISQDDRDKVYFGINLM